MTFTTNHATARLKERCGLPKKAIMKNVDRAFTDGICHKECTGRLKKYIDHLFLKHRENHANNIRLYGNHVYIFSGNCLITVLQIPSEHRNAVIKISKRKLNSEEDGRVNHV